MAILFHSLPSSVTRWRPLLAELAPDLEVRISPDIGDAKDIEFAIVWEPPIGLLASLPNLKLVCSLGAGVDHITRDRTIPANVPIARLVDPHMAVLISEYVALQTERIHRNDLLYREQQQRRLWREHPQPDANSRTVGLLGLGRLGEAAARRLLGLDFKVVGWSRTQKSIDAVICYTGAAGLELVLARADILVCLLPLTPDTDGILCQRNFERMKRGAAVVNCARGAHVVDADLIAAIDSGQLSGAVLDVFRREPLPADHPFWAHPRIVITPHVAAFTNPQTAARIILANIRRVLAGGRPRDLVDRAAGY